MFNKIKHIYSSFKNKSSFMGEFNEFFLERYLGHHKIIGWYQGCPVYSSFLIPAFSKPAAHAMMQRFVSLLRHEPMPAMVNISITDTCNAKCEHCSFFGAMDKLGNVPLPINKIEEIILKCQDFGISVINFVGGEPLLEKNLPKLIKSMDKRKSISSVFTNGWYLEEKAKELKEAGAFMVIVSLDSTDPKKHDDFRKLPGLFGKAIKGIKESQKVGLLTGISTTVTQEDLENGNFEKMIIFAKNMKINELIVFDMMPVGMYSHRSDLSKKPINRKMLFEIINKYNLKKDFPGIFSYTRFKDPSVMGCSAGRNYFYITPYGDVCPCDFTAEPVGNLDNESLNSLWFKLTNVRNNCGGNYINESCDLDTLERENKDSLHIINQ